MKILTTEPNKVLKIAAYVIIGFFALRFLLPLILPTPQLSPETEAKLDSLNVISQQLQATQVKYDSLLTEEEEVYKELDHKIDNIKERTTVIREYYHDQSQAINSYTPTELDSFFKQRYNY